MLTGERPFTPRTPGGTAAQEGTGHGRAMVPFSFLPHSIWEEEGEPLKGKPTPEYSAYGLHVGMGSRHISCCPGVVALEGPCRCGLEV